MESPFTVLKVDILPCFSALPNPTLLILSMTVKLARGHAQRADVEIGGVCGPGERVQGLGEGIGSVF